MREYTKAMEAAQQAQDADVEKKHTREIEEQMTKILYAQNSERAGETEEQTLQRAMRDPEIAVCIFSDPVTELLDTDEFVIAEHHERPRHATDFAAGSREPGGAAGSHEEPRSAGKDPEACRGWHHPHALSGHRGLSCRGVLADRIRAFRV